MTLKKRNKLILCADIGGTNANFSIVDYNEGKPTILLIEHYSTKKTRYLSVLVNEFLYYANEQGFKTKDACFCIAGPIEDHGKEQKVKMTNSKLVIDSKEIKKKCNLKNVFLINDFEAIAYSINGLSKKDFFVLNKGKNLKQKTRCVVGAGTGLGKSILRFSKKDKVYLPLASEGGHSDLPLADIKELDIAKTIMKMKKIKGQLEYEDIVSGRGLESLYSFYSKRLTGKIKKLGAKEISQTRKNDKAAKEAFNTFAKFYARCCKNFALDTLCESGIYIAGGISAKNQEIFNKTFIKEFTQHNYLKFKKILQDIPIYVITNYDISHMGCAHAFMLKQRGVI